MEPSYRIKSIRLIIGLGLGCSVVLYCLVLRWVVICCVFFWTGLFVSVLQRKNEDNRACNLFKHPHLNSLSCCGFLQVSSRRLTRTGRPVASPSTATGMALMMASWRTSFWCRQDAGTSPSTSTWYVQDFKPISATPTIKSESQLRHDYDLRTLTPLSKLFCPFVCAWISLCFVMCDRGWKSHTRLKNRLPLSLALSLSVFFSFSLRLSSSSPSDDFTEPRNLKLSLGLQPASEKPINSSFKPFVPLGSSVCVMHMHAGALTVRRLPSASSLSVWHFVSDSRRSL